MPRKPRNYSDAFKASAVLQVTAEGYPENPYAMKQTAAAFNIPVNTLKRWLTDSHGAPPHEIVQQQKTELSERLEQLAHKLLDHAAKDEVIHKMTGQQAVTSVAIAIDKMRLLNNLPTEIIAVLPDFLSTLQERGIDATEFFTRAKQRLEADEHR